MVRQIFQPFLVVISSYVVVIYSLKSLL